MNFKLFSIKAIDQVKSFGKSGLNFLVLFSFLALSLVSSCQNNRKKSKENVEGGPCSYSTTVCPAEVIDFFEIDSTYSEVYFVIKNCVTDADTITYSGEFGMYINSDSLIKKDIKIGARYKYEIKEILSGHCSPYLERLVLEKYEEKN